MQKKSHLVMPEDHMEKLYTSPNPLVRFVHVRRLEFIAEALPNSEKLRVLDAGCGEGHLIEVMSKLRPDNLYFGADLDPENVCLKKAKKRCPYAKLFKKNLGVTGFAKSYFDIVVCTETLEHIYDYEIVINELLRVLKKDGLLIVTFPNETLWTFSRLLLGRRPIKVPDHVNSFNFWVMSKAVHAKVVEKKGLPFNLPFFASFNGLMVFKK